LPVYYLSPKGFSAGHAKNTAIESSVLGVILPALKERS
jgi:hypothetical protein